MFVYHIGMEKIGRTLNTAYVSATPWMPFCIPGGLTLVSGRGFCISS